MCTYSNKQKIHKVNILWIQQDIVTDICICMFVYIYAYDLKLYYRSIVIKTAWYWYSDKQVDQWSRIEEPEMSPHIYGHFISDKGAKTIQWEKRQ